METPKYRTYFIFIKKNLLRTKKSKKDANINQTIIFYFTINVQIFFQLLFGCQNYFLIFFLLYTYILIHLYYDT